MIEQAYKQLVENVTELKVTPVFTSGPFPAVTYRSTTIQGGPVRKDQLEIRIIGNDLDELIEIRDKVIGLLDMEEKHPSISINGYVIRSSLSGGGYLFNSEINMWELYPIFTTIWRYDNEQK